MTTAQEYRRTYYERNRERLKKQTTEAYHRRRAAAPKGVWLKAALHAAKLRAKKGGYDFDLVPDDVVVPDTCPALGQPLQFFAEGCAADLSPTLDKIDPSKGYTKGNVVVISMKANRIKNNATAEEIALVAAWVKTQT